MKKQQPTYKLIDAMMETNFGLFVFILKEIQGALEDAPDTAEDQSLSDVLATLTDTNAKIADMVMEKDFFVGKNDEELLVSTVERLPEKNWDSIAFATDMFANLTKESLAKTKGKFRKKQEDLLDRCTYIVKLLYLLFNPIDSDTPYREAFSIGLKAAEEMLDDDLWKEDNEEIWGKDYVKSRRTFIKEIRDKLAAADKAEPLEKTLCDILDGLGTADRNYICGEVMEYAVIDTMDKIDEILEEYAGMEVDMATYIARAAAAKQLARRLRKKYAPPVQDEPVNSSGTEDTGTES